MISSISAGFSPAITSSSSSRRGRIASARAISSRFFSGSDRFRASAGARWSSLTRASTAIASARGSDVWRFGPTTPAMTFSNTETSRNGWTIWKVRPIPSRARRCGGWPVISRPSNEMTPLVGRMKPEMVSNSVVLPAPFGPIRPTISWPAEFERDLVDRAQAAEPARDLAYLQQRPAHFGLRDIEADSRPHRPCGASRITRIRMTP